MKRKFSADWIDFICDLLDVISEALETIFNI